MSGVDALEVLWPVAEPLPALPDRGLTVPVTTVLPPSRWLLFVATGSGKVRSDLASFRGRKFGK